MKTKNEIPLPNGKAPNPQQRRRRRRREDEPSRRGHNANLQVIEGSNSTCDVTGLLELHRDGYGFLRSAARTWRRDAADPFVPKPLIESHRLQQGYIVDAIATVSDRSQGRRVTQIVACNGDEAISSERLTPFEDLTPISPRHRLRLQTDDGRLTNRVIDLLVPIGKGQRALIVAPPRTGKTTLLRHIAQGISANHPEAQLVVLLVDERPEEVTEIRAEIDAEMFASNLDQPVENHLRIARLAIDRCKRLAEQGRDAVLVVDSLTRLTRASNKTIIGGPIATGGLNVKALEFPKMLFGAARALAEGGSLTTIATALIGTNSQMDEAIFQEFMGTGNMEIVLDPMLADRSIWPAMDILASRTRREELLLAPKELRAATLIRRTLAQSSKMDAMQRLTEQLARFKTNDTLIQLIDSTKRDQTS